MPYLPLRNQSFLTLIATLSYYKLKLKIKHAVNKIFASREAADINRAHRGCNCRIVKEEINWQYYIGAFGQTGKDSAIVYDKRWGWPPPLPKDVNLDLDSF